MQLQSSFSKDFPIGKASDLRKNDFLTLHFRIDEFSSPESSQGDFILYMEPIGRAPKNGKSVRERFQEIYKENPGWLYISNEEYNKLMEIWTESDLNKTNNLYGLFGAKTSAIPPKDVDFLKSLKVPIQCQMYQYTRDISEKKSKIEEKEELRLELVEQISKATSDKKKLDNSIDYLKTELRHLESNKEYEERLRDKQAESTDDTVDTVDIKQPYSPQI